jgi:hypothetical protein
LFRYVQTAASKLVKSLLEAVSDLKEAGEDAAEKRWVPWAVTFTSYVSRFLSSMN